MSENWKGGLLLTPTHTPRPLLANALLALREAPEWEGVLAHDEFAICTMAMKPPPWLKGEDNSWTPRRWTDDQDALAAEWLQHQGICVSKGVAADAVETVAKEALFHPIRDYLNGLVWDRKSRVRMFATKYLGAAGNQYHEVVSRCILIAAVARIFKPGCKVDTIPIIEAAQGAGKSSAIHEMFKPWFSDDLAELGTKDASMQVRCAWGIEIPELSSMTRGESERVKAFISRREDRFRPSYGRRVVEVPRQSVFWGTTNSAEYLKDETGGRRFWPIRCGKIRLGDITRDRDQLWGEAVDLYNFGVPWWMTGTDDLAFAEAEQRARYAAHPWDELIDAYVADKSDVSVAEILSKACSKKQETWTQADQNGIVRKLISSGWTQYWARMPTKGRRYRRTNPE